jgi:hypothetical protein
MVKPLTIVLRCMDDSEDAEWEETHPIQIAVRELKHHAGFADSKWIDF